ncbi:MAG: diguanylate cyclase [Pseudomonadota bacterium]
MTKQEGFSQSVLDSLPDHVAVITREGIIAHVNRSWQLFALENGVSDDFNWIGHNYLSSCAKSDRSDDHLANRVLVEIRKVLRGERHHFQCEYPCHSQTEQRWFEMFVAPMHEHESRFFVVSHRNVTQRVRALSKAQRSAMEDSLTGLANRRRFTMELHREWRSRLRDDQPLSLILCDIDYFKSYNDQFGHMQGDVLIKYFAEILSRGARRPRDMVARLGGDEFGLILGSTDHQGAVRVAQKIHHTLQTTPRELGINRTLTASFGTATATAIWPGEVSDLVQAADEAMYQAKNSGRNQIASATMLDRPQFRSYPRPECIAQTDPPPC